MTRDLIILGKGLTAPTVKMYWEQARLPVLWTLNDVQDRRAEMHFDVHEDRRFWGSYEEIRRALWIVSPFVGRHDLRGRMASFPLREVFQTFGVAYFECSLDYMLAMALLQHRRGLAHWGSICLPGCDMADGRHFTFRPGASFWLGVATGMGIEVEIPRHSTLLKRVTDYPPHPHGDPEFPHAYGQLPESTFPVAESYKWVR